MGCVQVRGLKNSRGDCEDNYKRRISAYLPRVEDTLETELCAEHFEKDHIDPFLTREEQLRELKTVRATMLC